MHPPVIRALLASAVAALVAWNAQPAQALDIEAPAKIIVAKETKVLKAILKGSGFLATPLQDEPTENTTNVTVTVFDSTGVGGSFSEVLVPGGGFPVGWKGLGNPAGSKGWKYKNTGGGVDGGPACKIVIIKDNIVKLVCKKDQVNIPSAPFTGNAAVIIEITGTNGTDRICSNVDASDEKKNEQLGSTLHLLKRKGPGAASNACAAAPVCCDGASHVAFSTISAPGGDCGDLTQSDGTLFGDVSCDGLFFGGGGNSVPLPATLPDLGTAVNAITSCAGTTATLGNTTSADTGGSNRNCTSLGCLFGAPLSIPNTSGTPTSTCVINTVSANASGTLNCATGDTGVSVPLTSEVFLTGDLGTAGGIQPCPRCIANTCVGGANDTQACTPETSGSGTLGSAYPTSHDCNPAGTDSLGGLPIGFALTNSTVQYDSTAGTGPNATQARVFCGFCRDAGTLAFEQPAVACIDNLATLAACGAGFPDCEQRSNGAFGPAGGAVATITTTGTASGLGTIGTPAFANLVSVFCIPPTFNAAVDAAGDLPGPGAAALPGSATLCSAASPCP